MNAESRQAHWEKVYTSKGENEVSWFQENPAPSVALRLNVRLRPLATMTALEDEIHGALSLKLAA